MESVTERCSECGREVGQWTRNCPGCRSPIGLNTGSRSRWAPRRLLASAVPIFLYLTFRSQP